MPVPLECLLVTAEGPGSFGRAEKHGVNGTVKEKPGVIAQFTPASLRTVSYCQLPTMNQILAQGEKARLSVPTREVR